MDRDYLEKMAIHSAPVYKLAECSALNFGDNSEAEAEADDKINTEIDSEGFEEIKKDFKKHIYFFEEDEVEFMNHLAEQMQNGALILKDDEIDLKGFFPYGYLFIFLHESELYLVLPDELREIYLETIAKENYELIRTKNQEMLKYSTALINLYGMYEIRQFAAVWNQHHKEKIEDNEAERFLNESCEFINDYYIEDGYVYNSFMNEEEIDDLLENTKGLSYFMPSKSIIYLYADDSCFEEKPEAKAVLAFLEKYIPNDNIWTDLLHMSIIFDCKRLVKPIDIVNQLYRYKFPVEDKEAMKEFERLYRNLFNNTYMWEFRGFTPFQFERETGRKVESFKIPEFTVVEKGKKSKNKKKR